MVQADYLVNDVAAQVQLSQRDEPVEVVDHFDQVVRQVKHSEFCQVPDVFNLADFVAVKVEHIQLGQVL